MRSGSRAVRLYAGERRGGEERLTGTTATRQRTRPAGWSPLGVVLVVLFTFVAWSLRVAFLGSDALSDLTLAGVANEAMRAAIFLGPVLLYLRYVERARTTTFLRLVAPSCDALWVVPLAGAAFAAWYLLLDQLVGDGDIGGVPPAWILFTLFSPATLVEEIYFRGFLLNKFRQAAGFWRANLASSALFALIHLPGWLAAGRLASPPQLAADALGIFVFGLVFGWAMQRTGSLWPAYLLHALNNLLVIAVVGA